MYHISHYSTRLVIASFAFIALFFVSCSEDDLIQPPEDHYEAEGVLLKSSGITIASIFQGATEDTLRIALGSLSDAFNVFFYDKDKIVMDPPADTDKKFAVVIDDNAVASFFQHPGEEGGYEFHLRGLKEGVTHIEYFIEHAGHNDYRSGKMPVLVAFDPSAEIIPSVIKILDEESGTVLAEAHAEEEQEVIGLLQIAAGDTTGHIEVRFFDASGQRIIPSDTESSITITPGNVSLLAIDGPGIDEPFAFRIIGIGAGNSAITVKFSKNGDLKRTFTAIPVKVNP